MKKILSILALVLAMTMVMSVSAFAAEEFSLGEGAEAIITAKGLTVTPAEDSIAVVAPATSGADYSILLVSGSDLPTSESTIAYINQENATSNTVSFDVLPLLTSCTETMTLYIGSNATGETLIAIPLVYDEEQAQYTLGCVTLGDTDIDISDVLLVLDAYLGTATLNETQTLAADVAPKGEVDGNVDISDVLLILDYYLGTVTSLN